MITKQELLNLIITNKKLLIILSILSISSIIIIFFITYLIFSSEKDNIKTQINNSGSTNALEDQENKDNINLVNTGGIIEDDKNQMSEDLNKKSILETKELSNPDKEYLSNIQSIDLSNSYFQFIEKTFTGSDILQKEVNGLKISVDNNAEIQKFLLGSNKSLTGSKTSLKDDDFKLLSKYEGLKSTLETAIIKEKQLLKLIDLKASYLKKISEQKNNIFQTGSYLTIVNKYLISGGSIVNKDLITIDLKIGNDIINNFKSENLVKLTKDVGGIKIEQGSMFLPVNKEIKIGSGSVNKFYVDELSYYNLKKSIGLGYTDMFFYIQKGDSGYDAPILTFISGYNKDEDFFISLIKTILNKGNSGVVVSLIDDKDIKENYFKDVTNKGILINLLNIIDGKLTLNYSIGIDLINKPLAEDLIRNIN